MPERITIDEILLEWTNSSKCPSGYLTTREWSIEWGITYRRAGEVLTKLSYDGRLESRKKMMDCRDGIPRLFAAYKIMPSNQKDEKK